MSFLFAHASEDHNDVSAASYNVSPRFGENAPKISIHQRTPMHQAETNQIGYFDPPKIESGPSYTIGSRTITRETQPTPGPNYVPPSFGSTSAKPSIGNRTKMTGRSIANEAGPAAFDTRKNLGADAPKYTLKSRPSDTWITETVSPGPAIYKPPSENHSPRYSIGVKSIVKQIEKTPGPADYVAPSDFGKKGVSIHGTNRNEKPKASSPGPADYSPAFEGKAPKYTIGHRYERKVDSNGGEYVNFPSTIGNAPKYTLSPRHDKKEIESTPGPNYAPKSFGSEATKVHISGRYNSNSKKNESPGPAEFNLSRNIGSDSPKYSLSGRNRDISEINDSPGPAAYEPRGSTLRKSGYTIGRKTMQKKTEEGPGYYMIPSTFGSGPKYSIAHRDNSKLVPI